MIKEAILAHPAEARAGIGRATIKKYIQSHHPETAKGSEASFNTRVNQAITRGAEKKTFLLPKGPSGKVKLAPKAKVEKKAPAAKKPAAKKVAAKKPATATATATAAAKKPAAKKVSLSRRHHHTPFQWMDGRDNGNKIIFVGPGACCAFTCLHSDRPLPPPSISSSSRSPSVIVIDAVLSIMFFRRLTDAIAYPLPYPILLQTAAKKPAAKKVASSTATKAKKPAAKKVSISSFS